MKNQILIILLVFSFVSSDAFGSCGSGVGGFFCRLFSEGPTSAFRGGSPDPNAQEANGAGQTEAEFCWFCREGGLRNSQALQRLPSNNPASGVVKVMQNMFRTCNIQALDTLPDYPGASCVTNVPETNGLRCQGNQAQTVQVAITNAGGGILRRTINPSYQNAYSPTAGVDARMCPAVVNGIDYAGAKKSFAMPSNFGVSVDSTGRPVVNLANCGAATQGGPNCHINRGSAPTIAPECYKMIQAGYMANCLKMHPSEKVTAVNGEMRLNINGSNRWVNTRMGVELSTDPSSCLAQPTVNLNNVRSGNNPKEPFLEGDVIVDAGHHSWMITNVGEDPLGVRKIMSERRDCSSITVDDMNLQVAQSTGRRDAGPVIVNISSAYSERNLPGGADTAPLTKLLAFAKRMCAEAKGMGGTVPSSRYAPRGFAITRHKTMMGDGAPQCKYDADDCPKIQGDECGKRCHGESV